MAEKMKNILVTGNLGYIGEVLTPMLKQASYQVFGLDVGYFGDACRLTPSLDLPERQIIKDLRDVEKSDLECVDAVIHLAALSNDPLGDLAPNITDEINYIATMRLAECAKHSGVRRFVYASSQSMYGIADTCREIEEDNSEKKAITAYAKAKWKAECDLRNLADGDFSPVYMRPSTVFGASPKLRCDIVFNNLVGSAYTTGDIEIKSDGAPWRPVVHVIDVCRAFMAGIEAPRELVHNRAFNVGIRDGNYTVRMLAEAARNAVPGCRLVFTGEHGADARTYRVSFNRILTELKEYYIPSWTLLSGGRELVDYFKRTGFTEAHFRGPTTMRLLRLKQLQQSGEIDDVLRWRNR